MARAWIDASVVLDHWASETPYFEDTSLPSKRFDITKGEYDRPSQYANTKVSRALDTFDVEQYSRLRYVKKYNLAKIGIIMNLSKYELRHCRIVLGLIQKDQKERIKNA